MTPYYEADGVTIYHGDCRAIDEWLTADVLITDPPYGVNYRSRSHGTIHGDSSDLLAAWIVNVDIPRCVFGATHFPAALPEPGHWVCWDKRVHPNADRMPGAPFEMAWSTYHDHDVILRIQHGGAVNDDKHKRLRHHPTQKPERLMRHLIAAAPPGIVADPFMGSGTTLRAAKDLGRTAIGVELDERYCEIAARRLAQGVLNFGTPA